MEHDREMREMIFAAMREVIQQQTLIVDQEARSMIRELKQMMESHERYCMRAKDQADERASRFEKDLETRDGHANEWRKRLEKKVDDLINGMWRKDLVQLSALVTILISTTGFFIATYIRSHQ